MKIATRKFGEIEIDETKILDMPNGLPGFDDFKKFVLLEDHKTAPFCWFQSVEEPNLALVIINPLVFKPDYQVDKMGLALDLGWKEATPEEILVYVVVNISGQEKDRLITANLLGPILINARNNQVAQVVLSNSGYAYQYNILSPEVSE